MKRLALLIVNVFLGSLIVVPLQTIPVNALNGSDWQAGRIIDDSIFTNKDSMSAAEIQQFLNTKVPVCDTNGTQMTTRPKPGGGYYTRAQWGTNAGYPPPYTCLRDFYEVPKTTPSAGVPSNNYGGKPIPSGASSAAQLIWDAAQASNISPKVLLTTIQKESYGPLTVDDWPYPYQYTYAMGAQCPDGPSGAQCDPNYSGFSIQIRESARLLRYYLDNMTQPWWPYAKPGVRNILYNVSFATYVNGSGQTVPCGGSNVSIANSATAALYTYTPYQPNQAALNYLDGSVPTGNGFDSKCAAYGNRNFWRIFSTWFGSSVGSFCNYDPPLPSKTAIAFGKTNSSTDDGNFIIYTGTSTNCVEDHRWQFGLRGWQSHNVSNLPVTNAVGSYITYGNIEGNGRDLPILVSLTGTGSGMVEFHAWDATLQKWRHHVATNLPVVDPAKNILKFADIDGDGRDEAIIVGLTGTGSGMVELHAWNPGQQTWRYHIITNLPVINPDNMAIMFGDLNGDRKDEVLAVGLKATGTGMVEFHVWNPGQWSWQNHIVSNLPVIDPTYTSIVLADTNGDGKDEGVLIGTHTTGSGMIEFHVWNPGFITWRDHIASNQPQL